MSIQSRTLEIESSIFIRHAKTTFTPVKNVEKHLEVSIRLRIRGWNSDGEYEKGDMMIVKSLIGNCDRISWPINAHNAKECLPPTCKFTSVNGTLSIVQQLPTSELQPQSLSIWFILDLFEVMSPARIEVKRDRSTCTLYMLQHSYLDTIVEHFNLEDAKILAIPMVASTYLSKDQSPKTPEDYAEMQNTPY
ncbi:hypothetical protein SERLA73DRAFT_162253 [Serpula lacrymans var. lacrymans S7.3]|uniref:Uncharacterized protein n=1 Tax=Serpula lacrymans var. lacrymans (strain S7.3) TaxID=936435 RepID=F8Q5L0_SERL3|nr:hypothetical protein SERLA73DRAFT_162253 [Serpula lacrymans var. lacrymans S7.3]